MENEFGFVGPNEKYMRHLVGTVRAVLGDDLIIYTTDPPPNIAAGSLADDSVYRQVSISRNSFPCSNYSLFRITVCIFAVSCCSRIPA